ncbi:RUS family member 1 [Ciona intestinalis]
MVGNIYEYHGSPVNNEIYEYDLHSKKNKLVQKQSPDKSFFKFSGFKQIFKDIFLPKGYPDSVSEDYLSYQIWDTVQAFCSSITGTLATHAVLKGSGVGDETANVASATMTWLLKDGTGMLGRIAFAYFKGSSLDCNAKQWRLFADVMNDCAIFIQLIAPVLPKAYFTLVMCLAGLAFSLVGVAGGCTRAALTMHQAKCNNMADVSAKDGSQETLVNLAALLTGLVIMPIVSTNIPLTWLLFLIFTSLHVFANYKAVASVVMELFNRNRFSKVIKVYCDMNKVLTPKEANEKEAIFFPPTYNWLYLGCKLEDLRLTSSEFYQKVDEGGVMYLIKRNEKTGQILVSLNHSCTASDILEAFYESYLLHINRTSFSGGWPTFRSNLHSIGWVMDQQQLNVGGWRWSLNSPSVAKHKLV